MSSTLTDGASAVLVCLQDYASAHGLRGIARIKSIAGAGCAPGIMGIGPVPATRKAIERAGLDLGNIDISMKLLPPRRSHDTRRGVDHC